MDGNGEDRCGLDEGGGRRMDKDEFMEGNN